MRGPAVDILCRSCIARSEEVDLAVCGDKRLFDLIRSKTSAYAPCAAIVVSFFLFVSDKAFANADIVGKWKNDDGSITQYFEDGTVVGFDPSLKIGFAGTYEIKGDTIRVEHDLPRIPSILVCEFEFNGDRAVTFVKELPACPVGGTATRME